MRCRFPEHNLTPPRWAAAALLVCLAAACTDEQPRCEQDWVGEVCATDDGVHRVTSTELAAVSTLVPDDDALLWRIDVNPVTGEPLFAIREATIACPDDDGEAAFAVLQARPPGVLFLAPATGEGIAFYGGAGAGPGEFSIGVSQVRGAGGCQVAVYDRPRHRLTWIHPLTGVDSSRVLPDPAGAATLHELVGALADGTLVGRGLRTEGVVTPVEPSDMDYWYHVGRYAPEDRRWEAILEHFGYVELVATNLGYGFSPFRPASLIWTEDDRIWVANGHWPVARAFGADGRLLRTIWLDLPRQSITDADWDTFRQGYARAYRDDDEIIRRRWELSALFNRPAHGPYFHEALAVMPGTVWLRTSEDEYRGWGSRWLVLSTDDWSPLFQVQLPAASRPLAGTGQVLLVQARGPFGETEFRGYRLSETRNRRHGT